mgnify:CR=1 FL=1
MNWTTEANTKNSTVGHWSPPFSIYESLSSGRCVASSAGPYWFGPLHTKTLQEAKAACEDAKTAKENST